MLFMCWTRETGVIPAALAGLLLGMKAPGAQMIASVTFIAILMTILIQAPTTNGWAASLACWKTASRNNPVCWFATGLYASRDAGVDRPLPIYVRDTVSARNR